jgi:hypothetical protein
MLINVKIKREKMFNDLDLTLEKTGDILTGDNLFPYPILSGFTHRLSQKINPSYEPRNYFP